jgi:hypothetical protein
MTEEKEEIMEIYKLHVEMADRVSQRRGQTNKFYISLLSALLAIISFYITSTVLVNYRNIFILIFGILGILLCILWALNINSYKQLNTGKFKVLNEIEGKLVYQFYKREWELLGEGKDKVKYFELTKIEKFAPLLLSIPFLMLIFYILCNWKS